MQKSPRDLGCSVKRLRVTLIVTHRRANCYLLRKRLAVVSCWPKNDQPRHRNTPGQRFYIGYGIAIYRISDQAPREMTLAADSK